jgi:hypothetical protein
MKKPRKKKSLTSSWEGPYWFVGYSNENGDDEFDEGNKLCIVRDANEHQWEHSWRYLQVYHAEQT